MKGAEVGWLACCGVMWFPFEHLTPLDVPFSSDWAMASSPSPCGRQRQWVWDGLQFMGLWHAAHGVQVKAAAQNGFPNEEHRQEVCTMEAAAMCCMCPSTAPATSGRWVWGTTV